MIYNKLNFQNEILFEKIIIYNLILKMKKFKKFNFIVEIYEFLHIVFLLVINYLNSNKWKIKKLKLINWMIGDE